MENTFKPVRVPIDFPVKYLLSRGFAFLFFYPLPLMGIALMGLPDGVLLAVTIIWVISVFVVAAIPIYYDAVLFSEGVQIRMFGKVIQQIPVSGFKLLCGVGDDGSQNLCLSTWDLEELALRREEILQKGVFSRQDLPFRKQRVGWRERFVKEYLMKPKWSIRKLHTGTPILWLPFDPVLVIYLRRLYPQLPYLDLRSDLTGRMSMQPADQIPFYTERYRVDAEGLHVFRGWNKQELRCFPAAEIKTIFRVDRFVSGSKVEPSYGRYLVVSQLSVEELAARGRQKGSHKWKGKLIDCLPEAREMYAAEFYFSIFFSWNWRKATECHIRYTAEAENLLRQLYPHAQWVDYSNKWL